MPNEGQEVEQTFNIKGDSLKKTGLYTVKVKYSDKAQYIAKVTGKFPFFKIEFISIDTFEPSEPRLAEAINWYYTPIEQ